MATTAIIAMLQGFPICRPTAGNFRSHFQITGGARLKF